MIDSRKNKVIIKTNSFKSFSHRYRRTTKIFKMIVFSDTRDYNCTVVAIASAITSTQTCLLFGKCCFYNNGKCARSFSRCVNKETAVTER